MFIKKKTVRNAPHMHQGWKFPREYDYTPREGKKKKSGGWGGILAQKLGRQFPPLMTTYYSCKGNLLTCIILQSN